MYLNELNSKSVADFKEIVNSDWLRKYIRSLNCFTESQGLEERRAVHSSAQPSRDKSVPSQPVLSLETEENGRGSLGRTVQHDDISVLSGISKVPSEKNLKNDKGNGTFFSSMEGYSLSDFLVTVPNLCEFNMPPEVRVDYFDVMILYAEKDYEGAEKFLQHFINEIILPDNEKCHAVLYDCPELVGLSCSKLQHLDLSMKRCTHVFVYMTANFVSDKWCEFSSEPCLMRAISDAERRWHVVPIYNERQTDCKFRIPMGLNTLKGINYYCNEFYQRDVSKLIGDKIAYRKWMQERQKVEQKKWVEKNKTELIETEEMKKRPAEQEDNSTTEYFRKKGLLSDSTNHNQCAKKHDNYFRLSAIMQDMFKGFHVESQTYRVSADMGVGSEVNQVPLDVKMKISPENFLDSLHSDQKQKYLDSLLANQQESHLRSSLLISALKDDIQSTCISDLDAGSYLENHSIRTLQWSNMFGDGNLSVSVDNPYRPEQYKRTVEKSQENLQGGFGLLVSKFYDKMKKTLLSGLPNEVDLSVINMVLNESKHTLQLGKSQLLTDLLACNLAMEKLYENDWKQSSGRDFIRDTLVKDVLEKLFTLDNMEMLLTLVLISTPQPSLFDISRGVNFDSKDHCHQILTPLQLMDSAKKTMSYIRRHKVQADYHNVNGITAYLVDALEQTVQGKTLWFDSLEDEQIGRLISSTRLITRKMDRNRTEAVSVQSARLIDYWNFFAKVHYIWDMLSEQESCDYAQFMALQNIKIELKNNELFNLNFKNFFIPVQKKPQPNCASPRTIDLLRILKVGLLLEKCLDSTNVPGWAIKGIRVNNSNGNSGIQGSKIFPTMILMLSSLARQILNRDIATARTLLKIKQIRPIETKRTEIHCIVVEDKNDKQPDDSLGGQLRCFKLSKSTGPIVDEDERLEESKHSQISIATNTIDEATWKRKKELLKSLQIHTIPQQREILDPLRILTQQQQKELQKPFRIITRQQQIEQVRNHSREFFRPVYNLDNSDKDQKSEEKDDCHALRKITWLPGEELPIPNLEYTVALVHSPAQKIMERIAMGERVGAQESMRFEILRVCTYRNYPSDNKPFRILLSSAGFYYASNGDEVVCYCCGVRRSGWVEDEKPLEIHKQLREKCDYFVRNSELNVPIPELPAENAAKFKFLESSTSDALEGQLRHREGASNNDPVDSQNGILMPPAKHPQYAQLATRLESFHKWPTNIPQTAQIMAECGYYYAGFGDCVRCFHCGIGLRHWTEDDYPWVEHARWSKDCAYLRLKKGEDFIKNVHLAIENEEEPEDLVPETPSGQPADLSQVTPNEDSNQLLLTDSAQSVLEMGYQPRIIKRAIDIILHNEGRSGINAQKIMETIFMLEERDNRNLQEAVASMNISHTSGAPEIEVKGAAYTSERAAPTSNIATAQASSAQSSSVSKPGTNAAAGQAHGRAQTTKEAKQEAQKGNNTQSGETANAHKKTEVAAYTEDKKQGASSGTSKDRDTSKIKAENRKLKEQTICKVCLDKPVAIVFLPCGHLVTCAECAPAMKKCPICRALVKGQVKAFMS